MSASAPFFARRLLQIPQVPGDVVDAPQDALPGNAAAAGLAVEDTLDSGDAAWMMTSTALVVMMSIPGLALFYGGLVRPKNVLSAFANVLTCVAVVTLVWVFYGYSIAFSAENMAAGEYSVNSFFGTLRHGGLRDVGLFASTGSYPATVFVTFHLTFAAITTALVTGAFAERMKPTGCLWFAVGWSTLVYCPLAHQVSHIIFQARYLGTELLFLLLATADLPGLVGNLVLQQADPLAQTGQLLFQGSHNFRMLPQRIAVAVFQLLQLTLEVGHFIEASLQLQPIAATAVAEARQGRAGDACHL